MDDLVKVKVKQARRGESLEEVRERFTHWRETRSRGEHIPRMLWAAAVGVARERGLQVVARELRVDSDLLKKRLEQSGGALPASSMGTQFVELALAPARQPGAQIPCECVLELENTRGAKMRVELNGNGLAGLAGLCSVFWSAA